MSYRLEVDVYPGGKGRAERVRTRRNSVARGVASVSVRRRRSLLVGRGIRSRHSPGGKGGAERSERARTRRNSVARRGVSARPKKRSFEDRTANEVVWAIANGRGREVVSARPKKRSFEDRAGSVVVGAIAHHGVFTLGFQVWALTRRSVNVENPKITFPEKF